MQNDNLTFNPIPVYFLSEHGYAPTQAGIEACRNAADQGIPAERWIENIYDGIVIHNGKDLLNPANLLKCLKSHPDAFLAVSIDGIISFCGMTKSEKDIVCYLLDEAIKEKKTSWKMLAVKIRKENKERKVPVLADKNKEN